LLTEVVGEFPETQGLMGKYYALAQGEDASVAAASEDHYKPQGPNDRVPTDPVVIAVALADKIDMLVGFWAIDEKPTGSKDPYALRRAALGVAALLLANALRLNLTTLLVRAYAELVIQWAPRLVLGFRRINSENRMFDISSREDVENDIASGLFFETEYVSAGSERNPLISGESFAGTTEAKLSREIIPARTVLRSLLDFFADRLKVQLREQGARHDLVDAVFALEGQDDLVAVIRRVEALGKFLDTDDGRNLLAGFKRAANILRIEEKKDNRAYDGAVDAGALKQDEEKALAKAIAQVKTEAGVAVGREDFATAMAAMAKLRPAVDAFFDKVTVNADDRALRENRLKLLNEIRAATRAVADFSRIEG